MCRYRYTQQPPEDLQCNPYTTSVLITDCQVSYGSTEEGVTLQWTYTPFSTTTTTSPTSVIPNNGVKYTIIPGLSTSLVRSQLQVASLTDSDSGSYSCQIRFQNGTLAIPSQALRLFPSAVFQAQSLQPCSGFTPQSEDTELCALTGEIGAGFSPGGGVGNVVTTTTNVGGGNSGGGGGGLEGTTDVVLWSALGGVVIFIVLVILLVSGAVLLHNCIGRAYRD